MTTYTTSKLGIVELTKRIDPGGNSAAIAEVLAEKNPILDDIPWSESNETFSNRTTRRSAEPSGSFRKLNSGVAYEASKTTLITDTVGLLESYSKTDVRLVDAAPSPEKFRRDEDMSFVSGLGKTCANKLFYGNSITTPEEFTGLSPRLDATSQNNVIDAGGSGGDTSSIFVVTWGLDAVHGIYGRGSKAGLQMKDCGIRVYEDSSNLMNEWYVTHFTWECGMVVRDPQCIGRIANIEYTGTSNIFNEDDLIDLLVQMETTPATRIYTNKYIMAQMWKRLKDKNNVFFSRRDGLDAGGMPLAFNGIPIRQCDQIGIAETAVS